MISLFAVWLRLSLKLLPPLPLQASAANLRALKKRYNGGLGCDMLWRDAKFRCARFGGRLLAGGGWYDSCMVADRLRAGCYPALRVAIAIAAGGSAEAKG